MRHKELKGATDKHVSDQHKEEETKWHLYWESEAAKKKQESKTKEVPK